MKPVAKPKPARTSVPGSAFGEAFARTRGAGKPEHRSRPDIVHLDPLIHERTRLSILTALYTAGVQGCSFSDLRDMLSLTDGNLMAHLRTLEVAELVARIKEGAGRTSNTTLQLSGTGKIAFQNYLDQLETLVKSARGK